MPTFVWEGRTRAGDTRRGTLEAPSEDVAMARLRADQISPTRVKKRAKGFDLSLGSGVSEKDLVIFTRQFATMIDAGLPLVQCLDILSTQSDNKRFGKILGDVKTHVESGATFSEALKRHPKVFDELYVNLVAAGEVGGILDTILNRLGTYIEKAQKLKRQVRGAMVYPAAILGVAIIVVTVLLTKVIPVFQNMFKEMKAGSLPGPTQVVIGISEGFIKYWYVFAGGLVAIIVGLVLTYRSEKGRMFIDTVLLKIPLLGSVLRKVVVARFTRTMGTLLASGVPILDALEIVAKTAGNRVVQRGIMFARQKISEGKDLAGPLAETQVFPPMVVQMIGVGEQTGAMDAMLQKIADFYEEEVDVAVASLTSLLEPIMMVFLGVVIGGLIIAMYLPIFELAGNIKAQ
ncbi:MAG TPA: type II secretion system F family protein [Haliangiales bacterium]|nr:type II secretion system F family protein [Haliangiales bacterium]